MDRYVWYEGKVWIYEDVKPDWTGRVSLVSLGDSSLGIGADPTKIRDVDDETAKACDRWRKQRGRA